MGSLVEKNGGLGTKGLMQEQMVTELSRNDTYVAPATNESKEHLEARTCDWASQPNQGEEEIVTVEAETLEEDRRLKSKLHAKEILLEAKQEPARRPNRRRKLRVYFP